MDPVVQLEVMLDQRLRLFERLDALSRRQSALIEVEDYEGLLGVVAEREEVVATLAALDEDCGLDAMADVVASAGEESQRAIEAKADRLAELEASVAARDESDLRSLEGRRAAMSRQMREVDVGRTALGAYGGVTAESPRFQDRRV